MNLRGNIAYLEVTAIESLHVVREALVGSVHTRADALTEDL